MRRRVRYVLAGAVAGSSVLAAGSTFAVFTDAAVVSGTAAAGSLTLTVGPDGAKGVDLVAGSPGVSPLHVSSIGDGPASLSLSVVGGSRACTELPDAVLTVTSPAGRNPVSRSLVNLLAHPLPIVDLDPDVTKAGNLKLQLAAATGPAGTWSCTLHLELAQDGGFSDVADLPLTVTVKPAKGAHGEPAGKDVGARSATVPGDPSGPADPTGTAQDGGTGTSEDQQPPVPETPTSDGPTAPVDVP